MKQDWRAQSRLKAHSSFSMWHAQISWRAWEVKSCTWCSLPYYGTGHTWFCIIISLRPFYFSAWKSRNGPGYEARETGNVPGDLSTHLWSCSSYLSSSSSVKTLCLPLLWVWSISSPPRINFTRSQGSAGVTGSESILYKQVLNLTHSLRDSVKENKTEG